MEDESFKNFMSNLGENDKSLYHLLCEKCQIPYLENIYVEFISHTQRIFF